MREHFKLWYGCLLCAALGLIWMGVTAGSPKAEEFLPLPDTMSIMNLGEITADDLGDASAWTISTVCREVNGKLFCYDSETDTNTTCRTVNGTLFCD